MRMTRRIEEVMGIPIIVEVRQGEVDESEIDRVFRWLRFVDQTFSTYIPDSEISRINAGELHLRDAHHAVRSVLSRCLRLHRETLGYFDVAAAASATSAQAAGGAAVAVGGNPRWAAGAAGRRAIDPSGFVKGWAIQGAGRILQKAGARNYSVNAGGDVCLQGRPSGGPPGAPGWRVGIQHPHERMAVAAVLELSSGAVATSGAYERGRHIVDPHTGRPPEGLLSVTIVGEDLGTVDAYATAAFAMGRRGAEWAARLQNHGAIAIFDDETIAYSRGVERYLLDVRPDDGDFTIAERAA